LEKIVEAEWSPITTKRERKGRAPRGQEIADGSSGQELANILEKLGKSKGRLRETKKRKKEIST